MEDFPDEARGGHDILMGDLPDGGLGGDDNAMNHEANNPRGNDGAKDVSDVLDAEKVTRQVVLALRTCGPGRTPLAESGMDTILRVIAQPGFSSDLLTLRKGSEVTQYVDNMWGDGRGAFLRSAFRMREPGDPEQWGDVVVFATNPLEALVDLVCSPEASSGVHWETGECTPDGIVGPMSAARARRREARVRELHGQDVHLLSFLVYSDKTHLDSHGHHKGHPVLIKLAGWKKEMWHQRRASRLVMLLPELPNPPGEEDGVVEDGEAAPSTNKSARRWHLQQRRYEIHHNSIDRVFAPLKDASYG
jgi:hypothetical protein